MPAGKGLDMPPQFGTSGLRGLVTALTPALVARYIRAFLEAGSHGGAVHIGWDLRPSSPEIARCVLQAVRAAGFDAVVHGALPTPALALAAMKKGQAAVMITGSHIPADRNGLKFYRPDGEISKADETAISGLLETDFTPNPLGGVTQSRAASQAYMDRYVDAFGPQALAGLRLGIYQHSSVARDLMGPLVQALGGHPVDLGRAERFVPLDTEAVGSTTRDRLRLWAAGHQLDAILSTDGDADRPMLADASGALVPGDLLGPLAARFLGADHIVTPLSSNTCVAHMPEVSAVTWTRIGSPFVIAAMERLMQADPAARVAGYEANGGFVLGYPAQAPGGALAPLMTRDSLLPMIAALVAMRRAGLGLAALLKTLPPRFTAADRLQNVPIDRSRALLGQLAENPAARAAFFDGLGPEQSLDLTDGLRVHFATGVIVHLRPSGNAPECRCYAEAGSEDDARRLVQNALEALRAWLG